MNFKGFWIAGLFAVALGGCNYKSIPDPTVSKRDTEFLAKVPNFELSMDFQRYEVDDTTGQAPGTIVVDSKQHFLYFVLPNKKAMRYGVATGSEAAGWTGNATVGRKAEWPHWMPPSIRSARARSTFTTTAGTRSIVSTAPTSRRRSAAMCPRAASACATST